MREEILKMEKEFNAMGYKQSKVKTIVNDFRKNKLITEDEKWYLLNNFGMFKKSRKSTKTTMSIKKENKYIRNTITNKREKCCDDDYIEITITFKNVKSIDNYMDSFISFLNKRGMLWDYSCSGCEIYNGIEELTIQINKYDFNQFKILVKKFKELNNI